MAARGYMADDDAPDGSSPGAARRRRGLRHAARQRLARRRDDLGQQRRAGRRHRVVALRRRASTRALAQLLARVRRGVRQGRPVWSLHPGWRCSAVGRTCCRPCCWMACSTSPPSPAACSATRSGRYSRCALATRARQPKARSGPTTRPSSPGPPCGGRRNARRQRPATQRARRRPDRRGPRLKNSVTTMWAVCGTHAWSRLGGESRMRRMTDSTSAPNGAMTFADANAAVNHALAAIRAGDPEPWIQCWADTDDVTLFGAWGPVEGIDDLTRTFRWVGNRFKSWDGHRKHRRLSEWRPGLHGRS